jgi:hypothetical protein
MGSGIKRLRSSTNNLSGHLYCSAFEDCGHSPYKEEQWRKRHERDCRFTLPASKEAAAKWLSDRDYKKAEKRAPLNKGRPRRVSDLSMTDMNLDMPDMDLGMPGFGLGLPISGGDPASSSDTLIEPEHLGNGPSGPNLHGINSQLGTSTSEPSVRTDSVVNPEWAVNNQNMVDLPYYTTAVTRFDSGVPGATNSGHMPPLSRSHPTGYTGGAEFAPNPAVYGAHVTRNTRRSYRHPASTQPGT